MARILAYTPPARGHLYPIVGTLLELRRRHHDVHVRTLAAELGPLRAQGLHAEPIAPEIERLPLDDWRWSDPRDALAGALRTFGARADHEVPDLERAIAEVDPDLLLIDITTVGAAALAEVTGLPWAQSIPFFQHFAVTPGAAPEAARIPFTLSPAGMRVLDAPRRRLGLPPVLEPADAWRAPLHLYYTAPPFEIPELPLPASFRLVGPGDWEPGGDVPEWLAGIEQPVVAVTASSEYQRDDALVEVALEALRGEDVRVVATTVAHDPGRFAVPANARLARWLPHRALVRRAACVVCHGGMGITQRTLAAGVPVCVVPFGRDQPEVAARVAATGAGTWVSPSALSPSSLRAAILEAMTMRPGAESVAAGLTGAGGAPAAADAVEELLPGAMGASGVIGAGAVTR